MFFSNSISYISISFNSTFSISLFDNCSSLISSINFSVFSKLFKLFGFIETNMTDVLKDDVKQEIAKNIPLKRMGTTQDVANVVKFLASDDSSYITGQVINVDGGMLM